MTKSTHGYHYPRVASSRILRRFSAVVEKNQVNKLPTIDVSTKFQNTNDVDLHTAVVVVDEHRYMVVAYMDPQAPINLNLLEDCPEVEWRGELAIFSLGTRVRLHARPSGSIKILRKAINLYISQCLLADKYDEEWPTQFISTDWGEYENDGVESRLKNVISVSYVTYRHRGSGGIQCGGHRKCVS
ncbi:hypothetical protein GALMADRAFT_216898 [Galerina marginata CBS 339.88]|uniref:Uncharacterized protein n=1 Tax=Galerina marginata (strain CBS 339.88) TaxID=685588 RepID=A0A067S7A1_GALM3|nr:hypothetical protein GALMADRAFT_216898 [Galerina marginata CBS 339.88]